MEAPKKSSSRRHNHTKPKHNVSTKTKSSRKVNHSPNKSPTSVTLDEVFKLVQKNDVETLKILLPEYTSLPTKGQQDKAGRTALHLASIQKNVKVVREILPLLAKQLDVKDNDGNTPLHYAAKEGNAAIEELLRAQANPCLANNLGRTPLHVACKQGHRDCVSSLLVASVDVNAQDKKGNTALHLVSKLADTEVGRKKEKESPMKGKDKEMEEKADKGPDPSNLVSLLIRRKADASVKNSSGKTAIEIALEKGSFNVVMILTNNGADISPLYNEDRNEAYKRFCAEDNPTGTPNLYGFLEEGDETEAKIKANKAKKFKSRLGKYSTTKNKIHTKDRHKKLSHALVNGELSNSMRSEFWKCCLGIDILEAETLYKKLLEMENSPEESTQVDKDINRCLRFHQNFAERFGEGQCKLYRILTMYSHYNEDTRYTQGMSTLAAILLIYFPDEILAFGAFVNLFADYRYHYFYANGLSGVTASYPMFEEMVKHHLPALHDHLDKSITVGMGITYPALFLPNWILECFYASLPFRLVVKIWDLFLLLGPSFLFSVALALLSMLEDKLMATKQADKLITTLKRTEKIDIKDSDLLRLALKFKVIPKYSSDKKDV